MRCSRRRGMIRFWDFKLTGAPPLLNFVVSGYGHSLMCWFQM